MCQLAQRIVLIHELRQLGRSEELLHCCSDRLDIDQGLRCDVVLILGGHTLAYGTLHSGETDTVLVLKQLANRTDTTVAQMVDIVLITDTILQVQVVVDGSNDVFLGNVLRNQLGDILMNQLLPE